MNDLVLKFRQSLEDQQRQENEDFLKAPDPHENMPSEPSASEQSVTEKPPTLGSKLRSVGGAAASATKEGAVSAYTHFSKGVTDAWKAAGQEGIMTRAGGIASGQGEMVLGGLTMLMTGLGIPQVAAAFEKGMQTFTPGLGNAEFLGPDEATLVRMTLGLPSMIGDPELRKLVFADRARLSEEDQSKYDAVWVEISKPMTYGEGIGLAASFTLLPSALSGLKQYMNRARVAVVPPPETFTMKGVSDAGRAAAREESFTKTQGPQTATNVAGTPPGRPTVPVIPPRERIRNVQAQEEAFNKTQGPSAFVNVADTPITNPLRVQRAAKSSTPPATPLDLGITAEDMASYLENLKGTGKSKEKGAGGKKSAVAAPGAAKEPVKAPVEPSATPEKATTKSFEEPTAPPEYEDFLTRLGGAFEEGLKIAEEVIKEEAAKSPELQHLVVATEKVTKLDKRVGKKVSNEPLTPAETTFLTSTGMTPEDLSTMEPSAARRILVSKKMDARGLAAEVEAEVQRQIALGEAGKADIGLLARLAVGAAVGCAQGDNLEDCLTYGLVGMVGAGVAGRLAFSLTQRFKASERMRSLTNGATRMPGFESPSTTSHAQEVLNSMSKEDKAIIHKILAKDRDIEITPEESATGKGIEMVMWERVREMVTDIAGKNFVQRPGELRAGLAVARTLANKNTIGARWGGATGGQGSWRVKVNLGEINKLAKEWDTSTSELEIARALDDSGSLKEMSIMGRAYFAIPESLTQAYIDGLLFGSSIPRNIISTGLNVPISIVNRSLADVIPFLYLKGNPVALGDTATASVAMFHALTSQFRMYAKALSKWDATDLTRQAEAMGATRAERVPRGLKSVATIVEDLGAETLADGIRLIDQGISIGAQTLARNDGSFKVVFGEFQKSLEASAQARLEGLVGVAHEARYNDLMTYPDKLSSEALVRIKEFRNHETFTEPFKNEFMRAAQMGPTDPWAQLIYRVLVFPFLRTNIRTMEYGMEHTPVLNVFAAHTRSEIAKGGIGARVQLARMATGSIIGATAAWLAAQGLVTGDLPEHPANTAMEHAGRPRRSVWDPISEKYRSYDGLGPVTFIVSTGADSVYELSQVSEMNLGTLSTALTMAITSNLATDFQSIIQSIGQIYDAAHTGTTDAKWEAMIQFIRKHVGSAIPPSIREILGGDVEKKVVKTTEYDAQHTGSAAALREWRVLADTLSRNVGGEDRKTIKIDRNMFTGVPLIRDSWAFNPHKAKPGNETPWASEIRRLNGAGLEPLPEWIGKKAVADIGLTTKPESPGVRLQADELGRWEVLMTQVVKDGDGNHLTQAWDKLVQSPAYKAEKNDVYKTNQIQLRWNAFKQEALGKLYEERRGLRDAVEKQGMISIHRRMPSADQPGARKMIEQRFGVAVAP